MNPDFQLLGRQAAEALGEIRATMSGDGPAGLGDIEAVIAAANMVTRHTEALIADVSRSFDRLVDKRCLDHDHDLGTGINRTRTALNGATTGLGQSSAAISASQRELSLFSPEGFASHNGDGGFIDAQYGDPNGDDPQTRNHC